MNILLINHYAGSPDLGMEFRPYYMAKEWSKQGHNVRIIGGDYSHLRNKQPKNKIDCLDGIDYYWVKLNKYNGNGVGRIMSMFLFVFKLLFCFKKYLIDFKPDVIIASSTYPLDIYPARKIAKKYNAKLCYEVHDLWPLSPMEIGGYSKYHPFIWMMQGAENYAYKYSDKIVSLLWNAKEHMLEHGMKPEKFVYIPNGFNADEWIENQIEIPQEHSDLFSRLHSENKIIIGFSGGHTPSTSMDTFIKAAEILKDHNKLAFVLVGSGISKNALIKQVKDIGLSNVYFLSPVNKVIVPMIVKQFDIAYMGGVHSVLHRYGTSFNKMTDYMLCSKPIICSVDEPGCLIERVQCGIRVEAENSAQVADAILHIAALSIEDRIAMGNRGKRYVLDNLEYSYLSEKMIKALN